MKKAAAGFEVAMGTLSCPLSPEQDTGDEEMLHTVSKCTFDVSSHVFVNDRDHILGGYVFS